MNMKLIHRWLLAVCIVIECLIAPTKGADLEWKEFCEINNSTYGMQWEFTLLDVPSRGHPGYAFKLYQQLPSGDWHRIPALWTSQTIFGSSVPTTVDIPFAITEHFFKKDPHNTHIVKATVGWKLSIICKFLEKHMIHVIHRWIMCLTSKHLVLLIPLICLRHKHPTNNTTELLPRRHTKYFRS